MLGDTDFTVAGSSSPTQSIGSTHSIDNSTEASSVVGSPGDGVDTVVANSVGDDVSPTTSMTTNLTASPTLNSCDFDKLAHDTDGTTADSSNKDTCKQFTISRDDCRAGSTTTLSDSNSVSSVRLRGNIARITDNSKHDDGSDSARPLKRGRLASEDTRTPTFMTRLQKFISVLVVFVTRFVLLVVHVVQRGLDPITRYSTLSIVKEQQERVPLTNAFFSLGTEVSRKHCPELWACNEHTQLSLLVVAGGACERYIWKELKEVVYAEENWARALYHLRHTLWPHGKVMKAARRKLNEKEREELKQKAAGAIKKFLPGS